MRHMIVRGLAVAASLALLSPAFAQTPNDPISTRYNSVMSTLEWPQFRSAGHARPTQDQPAPPALPSTTQQPSPSDRVVEPQSTYTPGGTDNYFKGNNCEQVCCEPNWVVGINLLVFSRDYEDDIGLSAIPSSLTSYLNSTSARMGAMGGVEAVISRRGCDGCGFEFRYWGLYPDTVDQRLDGSPYTNLTGLSAVEFGSVPVYQIYNSSTYHRIWRDNTFHNFEANLLRCIGTTDCGTRTWEWLAGFRYFTFDEAFRYATFPSPTLYYDLETENDLYGLHVGTRVDRCLGCKWGLQFGAGVGLYNNHIEANQAISDGFGAYAEITSGPYAGTDYNFESDKDEFAMSGEVSLGLTYQIDCQWRLLGGYRVYGFSGVALAPDQIPVNFSDAQDINRIDSNGSLILHGAYFGAERAF